MTDEKPMTQEERRKARRQAREFVEKNATTEDTVKKEKAKRRARAERSVAENTKEVPLMIGDLVVGKATVHPTGAIIARITESDLGKALYPMVKNGMISNIQLGASFMPEYKGTSNA